LTNKLVFQTRQCITNCTIGTIKLYEMDNVCYTKEDCENGNRNCSTINNYNYCDCKYLYSKTPHLTNNKYLRHCYDKGELCGREHTMYDSDTRICESGTDVCGPEKVWKYETRPKSTNILRCSNKCKDGEF